MTSLPILYCFTVNYHLKLKQRLLKSVLKGSCDVISSVAFSLERYKLFVHR